jgi:hypothetical protein
MMISRFARVGFFGRGSSCQHQRGNKECNAFGNHGDRLTAKKSER